MGSKITLDRETFKALAADTRVDILKRLSEHKLTLTDLSEKTGMSPSTIKEHLDRLVEVGLIEVIEAGTKWKYYRLTYKGENIVTPQQTNVWIVLGTSALLLAGSALSFFSSMSDFYTLPVREAEPMFMAKSYDMMIEGAPSAAGTLLGAVNESVKGVVADGGEMVAQGVRSVSENALVKVPAYSPFLSDPIVLMNLLVMIVSLGGVVVCGALILRRRVSRS